MPAVVKVLDEAARRESAIRRTLGDELRQARLAAGVSQHRVSRALGCSSATISRVERGLVHNLTFRHVTRHAVVVGLALRADLFPAGPPIRDAAQLKVLARLQRHVADPFRWVIEMPVGRGDLRAFDAAAIQPGCRVAFEAWSRVRDAQAQARSSHRKQLDAGVDRLVLVFGDTWTNRGAVRAAGAALRRAFPLTSRQVLAALRTGRDPGGNGIVFI